MSKHTTTSDATYDVDYAYSSTTGLLTSIEYPVSTGTFRFKALREYQYGLLARVRRSDGAQDVYWEAEAEDAFGNVIDANLGRGAGQVTTIRGFDAVTGLPSYIESGVGGGTGLQDFDYSWDKVGNLKSRSDDNRSLTETFYYDSRYRLDYSELNAVTNLDLSYDDLGNILTRSDVSASTWTYHTQKKHAVATAGSLSYGYDANGNMTSRDGDAITFSSYNYPTEIEDGPRTYTYAYDANRQVYKQVYDNGTESETTWYVADLYEKKVDDTTGDTIYRHTIHARGEAVALHVRPDGGSAYDRFLLRDHLGSVYAIVNQSGAAMVYESFGAFGEHRDAADWTGPPSAAAKAVHHLYTDRGFTDHDHLEDSTLIHMKGRVYDANIGRFLSPDPYITEPGNTQNYNRYSYVYNNPLS